MIINSSDSTCVTTSSVPIEVSSYQFKFNIFDNVQKYTGDYQWDGIVVMRGLTLKGNERYVVEHGPGVLHIYGPNNLRLQSEKENN